VCKISGIETFLNRHDIIMITSRWERDDAFTLFAKQKKRIGIKKNGLKKVGFGGCGRGFSRCFGRVYRDETQVH